MRRVLLILALLAGLVPASSRASQPVVGLEPGGPVTFGVYPKHFTLTKYAGLGAEPVLSFERGLDAARRLADGTFLVHLYASWAYWPDEREVLLPQIRAAAARGMPVNLALKFVPPPGREDDVDGFVAYVEEAVRTFTSEVGVAHFQITNEANIGFSSDSDGYYGRTARQALVAGVIAADAAAEPGQAVGFNWFYRWLPDEDRAFFDELGAATQAFRDALDWVGLDVYPGTYWPPPGSDPYASVVDAVHYLSRDLLPRAGLEGRPIFIQETGWPDVAPARPGVPGAGPLPYPEALEAQPRSERAQAEAARGIARAARTTRCTDGVRVLMWFPLLDAPHGAAGDGWGLAREDGSPKPAFHAFADEVRVARADRC